MNLQNSIIQDYIDIRNQTYAIIEGDFIELIKASIPDGLTIKDVTVIYLINEKTSIKDNTSSVIARAANMAFNNFSNRLKKLEDDGLIQREKNPGNKREHFITLTDAGNKVYDYYLKLLNDLFKFMAKQMKPGERLKLYRAIIKTAEYLNENVNYSLYKKLFNLKETLNHALTDIYDGIYLSEQAFLDQYLPDISLKEIRILIEIYILSKTSLAIPKNIHESIHVPYSTITHTIKKCEALKIIKKIQNPNDKRSFILSIPKKKLPVVESFIELRLSTFNNLKQYLSDSEWKTTLKAFKVIASFSK